MYLYIICKWITLYFFHFLISKNKFIKLLNLLLILSFHFKDIKINLYYSKPKSVANYIQTCVNLLHHLLLHIIYTTNLIHVIYDFHDFDLESFQWKLWWSAHQLMKLQKWYIFFKLFFFDIKKTYKMKLFFNVRFIKRIQIIRKHVLNVAQNLV